MNLILFFGLACSIFISTNIDNLVCLLGFFSNSALKTRHIVAGQFMGSALLVAASWICAKAGGGIPSQWVGILGFVPIALGLRNLWALRDYNWREDPPPMNRRFAGSQIFAGAAVAIANGGDNVGAYVPLMISANGKAQMFTVLCSFTLMTALLCSLGYILVRQENLGRPIRQYGAIVFPFVLIGFGMGILINSKLIAVHL